MTPRNNLFLSNFSHIKMARCRIVQYASIIILKVSLRELAKKIAEGLNFAFPECVKQLPQDNVTVQFSVL